MYPGRPLYPDGKRRGIRDKLKKDRPLNGVRLQKSVFDGHDPASPAIRAAAIFADQQARTATGYVFLSYLVNLVSRAAFAPLARAWTS